MINLNTKEVGLPKIGEAINLLSLLHRNEHGFNQFKTPINTALRQFELNEVAKNDFQWNPLKVTAHKGIQSLLDEVSLYTVRPLFSEEKGFQLLPDILGETRDTYIKRQENLFNIKLKKTGCYMLFELPRIKTQAEHEVTVQPSRTYFNRDWHLSNDWKVKSRKLRPGVRVQDNDEHDAIVTVSQSQKYLEAFYNYGTHFISALEVGDKLLQIIELKDHISLQTHEYWNELGGGQAITGKDALQFKFFTGEGFAENVGNIVSYGKDQGLNYLIREGLWNDSTSLTGNSLMAIFNADDKLIEALNSKLTTSIPIKIELTSLARFMEYFRAINFERILKGAIIQRWGTIVQLPLKRMTKTINRIDMSVLNESRSFCSENNDFIYGDKISQQDFDKTKLKKSNINTFHRILSLHETVSLKTINSCFITQLLEANSISHKASSLILSDFDFDNQVIVCQQMNGVLILKNKDETKQDTIVNGLRFSSVKEDNTELKIIIKGNLHDIDIPKIEVMLPCIHLTLLSIQNKLANTKITNKQRVEALSFVNWITTILPIDSGIDKITKMHLLAMHLLKVESIEYNYATIFDKKILTKSHKVFGQIGIIMLQPEFNDVTKLLEFKDPTSTLSNIDLAIVREYHNKLSEHYLMLLQHLHKTIKNKIIEVDFSLNLAKEKLIKEIDKFKPVFNNKEATPSSKVLFNGISAGINGLPFEYNNKGLRDNYKDETVCTASDFANHENRFYMLFQQMSTMHNLYNDFKKDKIKYSIDLLHQIPESHDKKIPTPFNLSSLRKTLLNSGVKNLDVPKIDKLLMLWDNFEKERIRYLMSKDLFYSTFLELNFLSSIDNDFNNRKNPYEIKYVIDVECFHINTILNKIIRLQEAATTFINIHIPKNFERSNSTTVIPLIKSLNELITEYLVEKKISQQN